MDINTRVPIQLSYKFANRFYGPILLLHGLNVACIHNQPVHFPDVLLDAEQSPKQAFHDFVNKLAQLCDIKRGGETVTAFTVLEFPDHIQYRFTSNHRESEDFSLTQRFVTSILNALGRAERHELQDMTSTILRTFLPFTRPRVEAYVNLLKKQTIICISSTEGENTHECEFNDLGVISRILLYVSARLICKELKGLQGKLLFSNDVGLKDDDCEYFAPVHVLDAEC
jgi:hypothetical protein